MSNNSKTMSDLIIIANFIFGICIIVNGVYLSFKIVKISIKEKSSTWKLDITNAIFVILHHLHCLVMEFVTFQVPNLYEYTGKWFCYSSMLLNHYGNIYTIGHSMIVGLLKYTLIVKWQKVINVGNDRVRNIFFFVNIFYAICFMLTLLISKPNIFSIWDSFARVDRCLGDPKNNWESDGSPTNRTQNKLHIICNSLIEAPPNDRISYVIQYGRFLICWLHTTIMYLTYWNVIECLIYIRLFLFMKR